MPRELDPDVLFRIPSVYYDGEGFHVSPDGQKVEFAWNKTGQWQIHLTGERPYQI